MEREQAIALEQDQDVFSAVFTGQAPALFKKKSISVQSFFPSKTFIARSGVNPMAAPAAALFSLIAKLRHTEHYDNIEQLRLDLIHEVQAFECAAMGRHYPGEQVVVARYVLCATLDETILRTNWGAASDWQQNSLVKAFQDDETTGEIVFTLLERLRSKPIDYIDMLEFFYLCLSLGFEGKYRHIDNGRQSLDVLLDDLYRVIRRERGDIKAPLAVISGNRFMPIPKKPAILPLKRILIATGVVLAVVYFSFMMMLHIEIQPIYQLLTAVTAG
ncbi:MAG: type IVB secretion system protein IcmH/DotU [Gammaproteobacteria bacterium]